MNHKPFYKFVCYFPARHWIFSEHSLLIPFFSFPFHCILHEIAHMNYLFGLGIIEANTMEIVICGWPQKFILWSICCSLSFCFFFSPLDIMLYLNKQRFVCNMTTIVSHFGLGQLHFMKTGSCSIWLARFTLWFMKNAYYHKIRK